LEKQKISLNFEVALFVFLSKRKKETLNINKLMALRMTRAIFIT